MEFGERLKALREKNGFTQDYIGEYVGVCRATISGYETRGYQPSHEKLIKLSEVLDISIDYLLYGGPGDKNLEINYKKHNKELTKQIIEYCGRLSYTDKKKAVEYLQFLLSPKQQESEKK